MNFKNRTFFVVFLVFFLLGSMGFAVCAGGDECSAQESKFKTLTVALAGQPDTLDPSDWRGAFTGAIYNALNDSLVTTQADGTPVLTLAESINQLDNLTYEIKLRQGVTFHNGDLCTADDMVFFIKRTFFEGGIEGSNSAQMGTGGPIKSVEAVDDYTVIIKLETPFDMWWRWRAYYAIPRKYFDEVGREGFMKYPIGVGPFKWVEGDIADYIVLERYEKYYGGPVLPGEVDQIPAVDRVIFRFISESTTRVAALLAGDVDIIQNIPPDSVKMLVENSGINVISVGGTRIATLFFNSNKPPFNNKRVRQAVAYAIDLDLIIEHQLLGFAEALKGRPFLIPFPGTPESGYYEHIQSPYDYNPERAKALLEETGVTGSSIILDAVPELSEVAQSISQMLNDIGFNTSVRVWERGVIREEFIKGQRDILIENWGRASRDPDWIKVIASTGDRGNLGNYSNPAFDDLILTAMHMDPNDPKRYDMYIEAYELAMEELPVFSLFTADEIEACQSYVKNYYPDTTGRVILHRVDIE